jgi:ankyrin repeat protein
MAATVEEIDYEKLRICLRYDDVDTFQNFYEKFGNKLKYDHKSSHHIIFNVLFNKCKDILAYLIEKDPSCINIQLSNLVCTPLIYSLYMYDRYSVKLLLEYGADPTIKDKNGVDALEYANMYEYLEIVEIIKSKLLIATKSANKR